MAVRVDPKRWPGEAQMSKRAGRKPPARLRGRCGNIPAERMAGAADLDRAREEFHRVRPQDGMAAAQHGSGEAGNVMGSRENPGVSGYASHHPGIFVVDFALNHAAAERTVILRGRDGGSAAHGRTEAGVCHAQGPKDFALAEALERLAGNALQSEAEDDKPDIAVLDAKTGFGSERKGERGADQVFTSTGALEQPLVCGKAGDVQEQHAESYLSPATVVGRALCGGKLGKDHTDRCVEVE